MVVGAIERGPEGGIQALDELWEGVTVDGKHTHQRDLPCGPGKGIELQQVIVGAGCGERLGDWMPDAAENTGGG